MKPSPVSEKPPSRLPPDRLTRRTPENPTIVPTSFFIVIFSVRKINAETRMARKTFEAVIIELFVPEVPASPR